MRIQPIARALFALALSMTAATPSRSRARRRSAGGSRTEQGAALPGASSCRNQASGVFRQGVSTADGTYFLAGVVPGVYELTAELSGFKK